MVRTGVTGAQRVDAIYRALASPPRREILRLLASGEGAEDDRCCGVGAVCACVFSDRLGIGAPTVSHHMKALLEAGLVTAEKRGLWVYYRLRPEGFEPITKELSLLAASGGCSVGNVSASNTVDRGDR